MVAREDLPGLVGAGRREVLGEYRVAHDLNVAFTAAALVGTAVAGLHQDVRCYGAVENRNDATGVIEYATALKRVVIGRVILASVFGDRGVADGQGAAWTVVDAAAKRPRAVNDIVGYG